MNDQGESFYILARSEFGPFAVVWKETPQGAKVFRVILSSPERPAPVFLKTAFGFAENGTHHGIAPIVIKIATFLAGEAVTFSLDVAAMEICSPFQRRVLLAEFAIPRGWVSTYSRIASHIGSKRGARAVGTALARNPFPIIIPCHRALRTGGGLGGYQGGLEMKKRLLEQEGLTFSPKGRVLGNPFIY